MAEDTARQRVDLSEPRTSVSGILGLLLRAATGCGYVRINSVLPRTTLGQ